MEDWNIGKMEGWKSRTKGRKWKIGMMEKWKGGMMEGWNDRIFGILEG